MRLVLHPKVYSSRPPRGRNPSLFASAISGVWTCSDSLIISCFVLLAMSCGFSSCATIEGVPLLASGADNVAQPLSIAGPTDKDFHFHISGIPETWKFVRIGFQTVTLFFVRP